MKFKTKTTREQNSKLSFNQRPLLSNTDSSQRNLTESFFLKKPTYHLKAELTK